MIRVTHIHRKFGSFTIAPCLCYVWRTPLHSKYRCFRIAAYLQPGGTLEQKRQHVDPWRASGPSRMVSANSTISPINPCATGRKISPGPTGRSKDPLSYRSAYPDFRRVGGQLRPPLANRFRYICPVVSDCAAGPRNWLMYSGSFAMMTSDNV